VKYFNEKSSTNSHSKKRLQNPSYLFRSQTLRKTSPCEILLNYFSQKHQQRSDYTCGPAALKMIADYYTSMSRLNFCGEPISDQKASFTKANGAIITASAWKILNLTNEFELSEQVKTTEKIGSAVADLRDGLMNLGLTVLDDSDGLSSDEHDDATLRIHKEKLWYKIKEILNLGVQIIINLRDRDEIGHYEVAIGVDEHQNIIFAEPGGALTGNIEFDIITKEKFIDRWRNMTGKLHGRFLILPPNEAAAQKIESILKDIPHYYNGNPVNKVECKRSLF
jgi:hypothetical protein